MRILVIGGTRFIGPHVVRHLSAQGHAVTVLHRGQTEADLPGQVEHVHLESLKLGDRRDWPEHVRALQRTAPEVVLDMIAFTEEDAHMLMRTFKGLARRVVVVSSADVYRTYGRLIGTEPGPVDPAPLTEDSPLREKLYPYRGETPRGADDPHPWMDDYDKILVERVVMADLALPGTIVRLPMVYGPQDGGRTFGYLKRMDDGRPAILLEAAQAEWRNTRGYVEDVARAIALAVTEARAAGRIYHVAEPESPTEREWVERIAAAAGWPGRVVVVPDGRLSVEEDFRHSWIVDSSRIRGELGYTERVPAAEALQRTLAWQRANPPRQVDPKRFDYTEEDRILAEMG